MNYESMSAKQINVAVAHALGAKIERSSFGTCYFKPEFTASEISPSGPVGKFNPCNSWADAGPIIQEYGIELTYDGISWSASCHLRGIKAYNDWKNYPESPCRLAMIVFLMIQESK